MEMENQSAMWDLPATSWFWVVFLWCLATSMEIQPLRFHMISTTFGNKSTKIWAYFQTANLAVAMDLNSSGSMFFFGHLDADSHGICQWRKPRLYGTLPLLLQRKKVWKPERDGEELQDWRHKTTWKWNFWEKICGKFAKNLHYCTIWSNNIVLILYQYYKPILYTIL